MFDNYKVKLTFQRPVLATNPCDPHVVDTHIINRQRELILDKSQLNKEVNKYLDAIPISKERGKQEIEAIFAKLEQLTGLTLSDEDKQQAMKGELKLLKETFKELDLTGMTVFFWDDEKNLPCIGDHMIYGYMKAASEAISRTLKKKNGTIMHSCAFTQSIINQHVRCAERFITFDEDIKREESGKPYYLQRSLRAMTARGPRISLAKSEVVEEGASLEFTLKILKNSPMEKKHIEQIFSYGELSGIGQWRNAGYGQFKAEVK